MSLRRVNSRGEVSENRLFAYVLTLVLIASASFFALESYKSSEYLVQDYVKPYETPSSTTSTSSSTSLTTSTLPVLIEPELNASESTPSITTTSTTTSYTTSTTIYSNPYLDRFRGMGYHKADLDIQYFCPSCVPAIAKTISYQPGVKSKSLSYGQDISYVIYDPDVVGLERIIELAGASGGVTLLNDTEL